MSSRSLQREIVVGDCYMVGIKNDYMEELYLRGVAELDDVRFSGFMSASNLGWQ